MNCNKPFGLASVTTEEDSEISYILLKVGPFKDRRSAQRKLTSIIEVTKKPKAKVASV